MSQAERIASLRIDLDDTHPPIWRRIEVPTEITLAGLHDSIQAAMGWDDYHLWAFYVGEDHYGPSDEDDDDDWGTGTIDAAGVTLGNLIAKDVKSFDYIYDMGDGWEHKIKIEAVRDGEAGETYPRFVTGKRRCPPEDVGGIPGFYHFLEAMGDPKHPDREELAGWYDNAFDPDDMDVDTIRTRLGYLSGERVRR